MKVKTIIIKGIPEKIIKVNGIWVYEKHFCEHCGKRISFNESQKYYGIPTYIKGHNLTPYQYKKGYHPSLKTEFKKGNEFGFKNPENIKKMLKAQKQYDTSIELSVQEHVKTLTDEPIFTQVPIHNYANNKTYFIDILIPYFKTVIEVNGCYYHFCVDCFPLQEDIFEAQEKRIEDMERINFLRKYGLNVIIIWEHDIEDGKYKNILKNELEVIKDSKET